MERAFNIIFFSLAKSFNNARNQLEFTLETRFARYQSKFSLISGIKKNFASLKKNLMFYAPSIQQIYILLYCTEVVYILWNLRQDMDHWQTEKKTKEFKKGGFSTIMMGILNYNHRTFTTLKRLKTKKRQKKSYGLDIPRLRLFLLYDTYVVFP